MSRHTCYILNFVTAGGRRRCYYGLTKILRNQTQQDACNKRLEHHIGRPLTCLQSVVWDSAEITPLGRSMTKDNALAQEAIYTAVALEGDTTARGAFFSCKDLNVFLRNSALMIRRATKGLEGQAARDAVLAYAKTLDEAHPLRKHLADETYRETVGQRDRMPPWTTRSGTSGSRVRAAQLLRGDYKAGDDRHRRLKRGRDPAATVRAENERRQKPRMSGPSIRKRLVAKAMP